jgi:hypothetical protein
MTSFNEQYTPIFNRVCAFLGNGWRIDKRIPADAYRISLMNPAFKNYSIGVRMDKGRIILVGGVRRGHRSNEHSRCTVAPTRDPWGIAEDIKRKILIDAAQQIATADADQAGMARQREEKRLVIGLLSRLVETRNYDGYYGVLCSIRMQGMTGDVSEGYGDTYKLKLDALSKDQLIRVVGFLSTLER